MKLGFGRNWAFWSHAGNVSKDELIKLPLRSEIRSSRASEKSLDKRNLINIKFNCD